MTLEELAGAISDGTPVDWPVAESSAKNDTERELVRRFRTVSQLAQFHATLHGSVHTSRLHDSILHPADDATAASDAVGIGGEPTPVQWGPLQILDKVGRGRFGDVYRAWDTRLDREVALKLLRHRESAPDSLESTVVEEGRLLARVRHPNVITVHGAERVDGRVGLWMEFIHGHTLEHELQDRGPFDPQAVVQVGVALCRALAAVHTAGLLHRDIKAQNVMRDESGRLVLGDFGTGQELDEDGDAAPGDVAGTPLYLAPEIFERQPATVQSDLYSLAVLLYHLLTRSYPVVARTPRQLHEAHVLGTRTSLREARSDLPKAVVTAVERGLDPDPQQRFSTATEMEQALSTALGQRVVGVTEGTAERPTRTRRLWVAVGAVVLLAAVAGTTYWLRPAQQQGNGNGSGRTAAVLPGALVLQRVWDSTTSTLSCSSRPSADGRLLPCNEDGGLVLYDTQTRQTREVTFQAAADEFRVPVDQVRSVAWPLLSPDGRRIAIQTFPDNHLYLVAVDGSGERILYDGTREPRQFVRPLDWTSDGTQIVGILSPSLPPVPPDLRDRPQTSQIVLVSADTGLVRVVRAIEHGVAHLRISPDGRYLAYDVPQEPDSREHDIVLFDLLEDRLLPLPTHPAHDHSAVWSQDGSAIVFQSARGGTNGLWVVAVEGGRPRSEPRLIRDTGRSTASPLGFTEDGALFYRLQTQQQDSYIDSLDPASGQAITSTRVSQHTLENGRNAVWSATGRSLAYVREAVGSFGQGHLVVRDVASGDEREFPLELRETSMQWSPDGRRLALSGSLRQVYGTYVIDAVTGTIVERLVFGGGYPISWTADGTSLIQFRGGPRLLFITAETGRAVGEHSTVRGAGPSRSLYIVPQSNQLEFATDRVLFENEGEWTATMALSPDGLWVAFTTEHATRNSPCRSMGSCVMSLRVVSSVGGQARELYRGQASETVVAYAWMPDSSEVIFGTRDVIRAWPGNTPEQLWRLSPYGGPRRRLGVGFHRISSVSVHPSNDQLAISGLRVSQDDGIWVMENFLPGL